MNYIQIALRLRETRIGFNVFKIVVKENNFDEVAICIFTSMMYYLSLYFYHKIISNQS